MTPTYKYWWSLMVPCKSYIFSFLKFLDSFSLKGTNNSLMCALKYDVLSQMHHVESVRQHSYLKHFHYVGNSNIFSNKKWYLQSTPVTLKILAIGINLESVKAARSDNQLNLHTRRLVVPSKKVSIYRQRRLTETTLLAL